MASRNALKAVFRPHWERRRRLFGKLWLARVDTPWRHAEETHVSLSRYELNLLPGRPSRSPLLRMLAHERDKEPK